MIETVACLGGDLSLYLYGDGREVPQVLIPLYSGGPWADQGACATSGIGFGGPLPVSTVKEEGAQLFHRLRAAALKAAAVHGARINHGRLSPLLPVLCDPDASVKTLLLALQRPASYLFDHRLSGNVRTAIRRSQQEGFIFRQAATSHEVEEACLLINRTQASVGSDYLTPCDLLQRLTQQETTHCELHIATHKDNLVAAAVLLVHRNICSHWLHGWNRDYAARCANQGILWHMIGRCAEGDVRYFDFGISSTLSIYKSKRRWGALPFPSADAAELCHG